MACFTRCPSPVQDRYITSRFLPDKAIDLMDEACAIARVQVDSKPEIMDRLERHIFQLGMYTCFKFPGILQISSLLL